MILGVASSGAKPTRDGSDRIPAIFPDPTQSGFLDRWLWRWDVRTGQRLSSIRYLTSRVIRWLLSDSPWARLACEIVRECYSLPRRIGTICTTKLYRYGVTIGHVQTSSQYERTLACTRDMQRITSRYRWATSLEVLLLVEAWQMGAEWACCKSDNVEPDDPYRHEL